MSESEKHTEGDGKSIRDIGRAPYIEVKGTQRERGVFGMGHLACLRALF